MEYFPLIKSMYPNVFLRRIIKYSILEDVEDVEDESNIMELLGQNRNRMIP